MLTTTANPATASCTSRLAPRRDKIVPAHPRGNRPPATTPVKNPAPERQPKSPEDTPSEFGARLRAFREQRGLTLTALADETGLSKGYLSSLETKHQPRRPSAEVLYALAQALGVTMSDLMGRKLLAQAAPQDVPPSLQKFAEEEDLTEADVAMLASIRFRGEQPATPARWRYIYQSIRASAHLDE